MSKPKTIDIKILVAVDPNGKWQASGWGEALDLGDVDTMKDICLEGTEEGERLYWVTATLPVPPSDEELPKIPARKIEREKGGAE